MDIPLKHLVGTVSLMSLIIATGFSYTMITTYIETEVQRRQLHQVAEYVALNLVELMSLVNFSNYSSVEPVFKVLKLPKELGGRPYIIELLNETSQGRGCYVRARLADREDVEESSPLPVNALEAGLELRTQGEGAIPIMGGSGGMIQWSGRVYGGAGDIVVWGLMDGSTQTAGIGVWRKGG
ncbi:MAG: hypothetical protein QW638_05445 [Candidatus Bathyarchaeia archaeon]